MAPKSNSGLAVPDILGTIGLRNYPEILIYDLFPVPPPHPRWSIGSSFETLCRT